MDHEESLIRAFIRREKRDRFVALLKNPKRRRDATRCLAHLHDLDARYASPVPGAEQSAAGIESLLHDRGAPEQCHVISEQIGLDGKEMRLSEALSAIVGFGFGTLVSCIPGQLGYYEAEDPGERYILERKPGLTTA